MVIHAHWEAGGDRAGNTSWFSRLEWLLSSWAVTLRFALLLILTLAGAAVIAAMLGVGCPLLLAVVSLMRWRGRAQSLARRMLTSDVLSE